MPKTKKSQRIGQPLSECCKAKIMTGTGIGACPLYCMNCKKLLDLEESQNYIKCIYDNMQDPQEIKNEECICGKQNPPLNEDRIKLLGHYKNCPMAILPRPKEDWEEKFDKLALEDNENYYDEEDSYKKLKDFIRNVRQEAYKAGEEKGLDYSLNNKAPMGCSVWRAHGGKYGYWDFFKKDLISKVKELAEFRKKEDCESDEVYCIKKLQHFRTYDNIINILEI